MRYVCLALFSPSLIPILRDLLEPNARRHDNMGLNMSLAVVQTDINRKRHHVRYVDSR